MSDEQPADMLARLGSNGLLWAQEFHKTAVRLGYSEMDEGWITVWFANAIESSCNPLRNQCDALRAELAAEREKHETALGDYLTTKTRWNNERKRASQLEAERDTLRNFLWEAREQLWLHGPDTLCARIDTALNKGGTNE